MALMFGHANALCIGVFISIIYIQEYVSWDRFAFAPHSFYLEQLIMLFVLLIKNISLTYQ